MSSLQDRRNSERDEPRDPKPFPLWGALICGLIAGATLPIAGAFALKLALS